MSRSEVGGEDISEVVMGGVLPAGVGQALGPQAALGAGISDVIPCAALSKVCGSGMRAIMLGHDMIKAGSADVVVAAIRRPRIRQFVTCPAPRQREPRSRA